jgi:hypothetical protein
MFIGVESEYILFPSRGYWSQRGTRGMKNANPFLIHVWKTAKVHFFIPANLEGVLYHAVQYDVSSIIVKIL